MQYVIHTRTNNKMDKQKKALSREIDAIIVGCALGEACDEAELVRLAIEYATVFRCNEYKLSANHMRSLETEAERDVARQLEANVNKVVKHTIRRTTPGLMGQSLLAMQRFTAQPKPARKLMRACKCTTPKRSPNCNMPVELCKHTRRALAKTVPRQTKSPGSPRTRKSGGKQYWLQ